MRVYVNFGEWSVAQAANEGFDGIRCDIPNETFALPQLVDQFVGSSVQPLFLIHDVAMAEPLMDNALPALGSNWAMEIFNEPPGMDHVTDQQYIEGIAAVHHDARVRGFTGWIISGGLANLERENLRRYEQLWPQLPPDVVCGFHRYSYKTQTNPHRPWPGPVGHGFRDRTDELEWLITTAAGRSIACTEFGYHTAEETEGFWIFSKQVRLTDQQVYDFLCDDLRLYNDYCVLAAIYQWRDGNTDNYLGRYGLHDINGQPKPQCAAVRDWDR